MLLISFIFISKKIANHCVVLWETDAGSGIFVSPSGLLIRTGSVGVSLVIWMACGLLSLLGKLILLNWIIWTFSTTTSITTTTLGRHFEFFFCQTFNTRNFVSNFCDVFKTSFENESHDKRNDTKVLHFSVKKELCVFSPLFFMNCLLIHRELLNEKNKLTLKACTRIVRSLEQWNHY